MSGRRDGGFAFPPLEELPVVTGAQARATLSDRQLRWLVETGRWQRIHHNVFVTHNGQLDWPTRAAAAILAVQRPATCRPRDGARPKDRIAGLAGWSAAYVDGLTKDEPDSVTLAVPFGRRPRTPEGSRVLVSRTLIIRSGAWPPRTSIDSTVIGLAVDESVDTTLAVIGRALQQRRTTMRRLATELGRWPRHSKRRFLTDLLASDADGAESALELWWVKDVEKPHGIARPTRQLRQVIAGQGRRYDLDWDLPRLRIELDGFLFHTQATALADRQKLNSAAHGDRALLRFGWQEVTGDPCVVAAEVIDLARARGADWSAHTCAKPGCAVGTWLVDERNRQPADGFAHQC